MTAALTGPVLITGTDTGVGKTIVTAAVAACATAAGLRVAVVKPGQTGVDPSYGEVSDEEVVVRLAGPATTLTLATFPDPLAPLAAARVAQAPPLDLYTVVDAVKRVAQDHDLVLVEGAGGLLVPMGPRIAEIPGGGSWTVADLAVSLGAPAIVVTRAGLGTLNHTALTLEALERRGIAGLVAIGAWPAEPELVHFTNLDDLPGDLHGLLPDGAGAMEPGVFRRSAPGWLTETLYGACDDPRSLADDSY
jgi:dethiobiotin synthetase